MTGKSELISNLIWLITHIGSDNEQSREAILNSNIFEQILEILEKGSVHINVLKHGIWLLSSISKGGDVNDHTILERILKILCIFVRFHDQEVVGDSIWGLSNFSNTRFTNLMNIIIDMGVIPVILNYDHSYNIASIEAPVKLIGNILTGDDHIIDEMLKLGIIEFLEKYLNSKYSTIRREATWCLSNIAAGTKYQINTLISSTVMPKIYELVKDSSNDVVRECIWVISNCLSGSDLDMCIKLANQNVVNAIIYVIIHHSEPSIIGITLEGLKKFFEHGEVIKQFSDGKNPFVEEFFSAGGVDYLEKLKQHKNNEIFLISSEILELFFNCHVLENS
jgi:hypothetical protein